MSTITRNIGSINGNMDLTTCLKGSSVIRVNTNSTFPKGGEFRLLKWGGTKFILAKVRNTD
jgi:hypothetical protein